MTELPAGARAVLRAWTTEREMLLQPLYDQINELRMNAAKCMDAAESGGSQADYGAALLATEAYGIELAATAITGALRKVEDRLAARMVADGAAETAPARLPDAWAGVDMDDDALIVGVLHDAQVEPGSVNPRAWPYVARLLRAATGQLFGTPLGLKAAGQIARAMTQAFMGERAVREMMDDAAFADALLNRCGFIDGAEVTADGSAANDLAHERREVVVKLIDMVRRSSWPEGILNAATSADHAVETEQRPERDDT